MLLGIFEDEGGALRFSSRFYDFCSLRVRVFVCQAEYMYLLYLRAQAEALRHLLLAGVSPQYFKLGSANMQGHVHFV